MTETEDPRDNSTRTENVSGEGPWPFVTRRFFRRPDQSTRVWSSRHHRKRLRNPEANRSLVKTRLLSGLWMPGQLNWWIGTIFAIGSSLFMIASILSLFPRLATAWALTIADVNAIFFAGSIPFTTAASLQLFQAANASDVNFAGESLPRRTTLIGWRPGDIGWLSCLLQFVGTVLFNFNTFDAMIPGLNWFQQDLLIWVPNIVGSILFLISGYLAFIETTHSHWAWKPKNLSWWVVFANLLGCLGFIVSAVLAVAVPGYENAEIIVVSTVFTLLGACGFLIGSLLMLVEAAGNDQTTLEQA